ncbi:MAG: hypothetical protein ACREJ2_11695 [Planctomycetota bacterium]
MTGRFVLCAPAALGGSELAVFGPSTLAVTWSQSNIAGYGLQSGLATDGKSTFLVGTTHLLTFLRSIDGGHTFAALATAHDSIVTWATSGSGVWIGGQSGNALYRSIDNGATFTQMQVGGNPVSPIPGGVNYELAYGNGFWFAVDTQGTDYSYSRDGGFHWTHPALFAVNAFRYLLFDGTDFAATATPNAGAQSVCTTSDGKNWTANAVTGADAPVGIAAGAGVFAIILQTALEPCAVKVGNSWAAAAAAASTTFKFKNNDPTAQAVAVTSEGRIVVAGSYGSIASSVDQGKTWIEDDVPWDHNNVNPTNVNGMVAAGASVVLCTGVGLFGFRQALC